MSHLFKPVVVRLAVFVSATLLVLAGLAVLRAPSPRVVQAETPGRAGIDLADAPAATPSRDPLTLPGVRLKARSERTEPPAAPTQEPTGGPDGDQPSPERTSKPGAAGTDASRNRAGSHAGQSGRRTTARAGDRAVVKQGGRDISWPQCPTDVGIPDLRGQDQPMPPKDIRFVVIGLTNGRAFTPNPCLERHLDFVRKHHVWTAAYAFTTYPTDKQLRLLKHRGPFDGRHFGGKLRNAGYAAAQYNIRTMRKHDFRTPHVWLDVEASPSRPWSGRADWNRAVVEGWIRAYEDAGYTVGFYSTRHIWRTILGDAKFRLPEWRTAGPDDAAAALGRCSERSFQGGRAVLAQWWDSRRDYNRMCPGFARSTQMARYFHQY